MQRWCRSGVPGYTQDGQVYPGSTGQYRAGYTPGQNTRFTVGRRSGPRSEPVLVRELAESTDSWLFAGGVVTEWRFCSIPDIPGPERVQKQESGLLHNIPLLV